MIKKLSLSLILSTFLGGSLFASVEEGTAACPTIVMSGTNVSCYGNNNGSANVAISNGSGNYTVSWSTTPTAFGNSIAGLAVGTYTVTVKDNVSGCTVVGAYVVTSPDPIAVSENITNVDCNANNTGAIDITVVGGTAPYTYSWSNSTSNEDLAGVTAGTYTLNITDARGCTYSEVYTITQPAEALNSSALVNNATCEGAGTGSIDVSVWGGTPSYTYSWSSGQSTQDVSGLVAGTYILTITDFNNCVISNTYNITQPAVLAGTMSSTPVLCYGDPTGNVSISPTGGTMPYSYSWQNSLTLYSENTANLNGIIADDYQVTVTDANGCQFVNTTTVTQPTELTATVSGVNVNCFGGSDGSVDLTPSGGTLPYSYAWTNSLGTAVGTGQDLTNIPAEDYTVVITDGNGCTFTISQSITQPNLPITSTETVTDVLCHGDNTGAVDLYVIGGTPPFTYSWTSGQTTEDINNLFEGTYGYTIIDANGCTLPGSVTVIEPLAPLAVTEVITNVNCFGESNGIIDLTVTGGTTPYTYTWSNSSYELSDTGEDLINYPADDYRYEVVDAHGCFVVDTLTITEPPVLETDVVGVNILCHGGNNGSVDLTVVGGVMPYAYLWNNGAVTEDINTLYAGYYEVTVTDDHGCTIMDSITLTEPSDSLDYTYTVEDVLCKDGTDGEIDIDVTGGTTPYAYAWSNGDTLDQIFNLTAGYYEFVVTDNNGCLLSDSIYVDEPDAVTLNEVITPVNCFGESNGIIDITPTGGIAPYSFTWYNSAFALSAQTEDLVDYPADVYQLEIIDSNNCFYEMFLEIVEPELLEIEYTYTVVSCQGGTDGNILVDITGGNPGYTTTWSNGATTEDLLNIPSDFYELNVVDTKGCSDSIEVTIAQPDSVLMTFEHDQVSCIDNYDGVAYSFPTGGNGGYYYSWSNGTTSPVNSGLSNEWYTLTVTDVLGCTGVDSVYITKDNIGCVDPVNAFSPNGDAYNDFWRIDNMDLYPEAEVQIFNKWGNLVHEQKGLYEPWDGSINGVGAPSEVYYWIINLNHPEREVLKGNITIVR